MKNIATAFLIVLFNAFGWMPLSAAEPRFPPPEFETRYSLPATLTPAPRSLSLQHLDVVVLLAALALACYFIYKRRSRKAVVGLSLLSLGYFGFYREGCICAIGSVQNVSLSLFGSGYVLPVTVLVFFVAPLLVALFAGRAFCAAVCPHGALQDLVLLKPVKVPLWLEHGLGLIPFLYLGAAVAFAATGSAFIICRYDPFVPLFRLSGSFGLLLFGGGLLLLGVFVGRPYCRFLCPFGALLKLAGSVSKWRVTITPDSCTQCRLCENSCPYNAIREPQLVPLTPQGVRLDRRRLGWIIAVLPALVLGVGWIGAQLAPVAARVHPTVELGERFLTEQKAPVPWGVQTAPALALARANQDPKTLLAEAVELRGRFVRAGWLFGGWVGLVIGLKLIALSFRQRRTDYEPDRGACVECARCFSYCPNELARCGLAPSTATRSLENAVPETEPARAVGA